VFSDLTLRHCTIPEIVSKQKKISGCPIDHIKLFGEIKIYVQTNSCLGISIQFAKKGGVYEYFGKI